MGDPTSETDLADRENKRSEGSSQRQFYKSDPCKHPEENTKSFSLLPKLWEIRYIFQSLVLTVLYHLKKQEAGRAGALGAAERGDL